ncbi:uncharacterized protein PITG_18292 [Phytophthora infestans T30-4]|uniref:Uncharacterized protein n=1 Tax=Phytophthora infestans (strain T30-4) TaxID=403677 RepID=D0NXT3_PHYIT|nr:uncharacterized protein PITG_18292 [Phytophthora infestans T30-4]EEY67884.1 hypothetical protein PITG_18292 [Phytophthora infestans T30-4]|eukprot:XP_002997746.1 hypothetical protein PITG_18292 [Phytophthora infestans T30-4]
MLSSTRSGPPESPLHVSLPLPVPAHSMPSVTRPTYFLNLPHSAFEMTGSVSCFRIGLMKSLASVSPHPRTVPIVPTLLSDPSAAHSFAVLRLIGVFSLSRATSYKCSFFLYKG